MSRASPVSRAASVCRDNFQAGRRASTVDGCGRADAMNRGKPERACFVLSLA